MSIGPIAAAIGRARAVRRDHNGRKTISRMPRATGRQVAREYWQDILRHVVTPMIELIRSQLLTQLEGLATVARGELGLDSMRADVADLVRRLREDIESRLAEEVPESALRELALRRGISLSELNRRTMAKQFKRVLGIDVLADDPALERRLQFFAAENVEHIKSLESDHLRRIASIITSGLAAGKSTRQLTREITTANGIPRRRAALIARDQMATLNGQLTKARQQANGVTEFIWRSAGDDRVRDEHDEWGIDGQRFTWAEGHPTEGFPGQPVNCRCIAEPVLE